MAAKINWHRYGTELRHCHLMYNPAGGVPWNNSFYLLDAVLALVLAMALCPSVRRSVSVKSRSSTETAERIELVFGVGASFHLSYTLLTGNSSVSKNKGTSLWNLVPNSGFRKFRHGIWIFERAINLARERWTLRA